MLTVVIVLLYSNIAAVPVSGFEYIVVVVSWDRCSVRCCISMVTVCIVSKCSGFNAVQCNSLQFQIPKAFNNLESI